MILSKADVDRFRTKYTQLSDDECWEWEGGLAKGYGRFVLNRKLNAGAYIESAHRVAYAIRHPFENIDDLLICHKCDNPKCVNWHHLFLGTRLDNNRDMFIKGRNVSIGCPKFTPEDILRIRGLYPQMSQSGIARLYGVVPSTIHSIVRGKRWTHV